MPLLCWDFTVNVLLPPTCPPIRSNHMLYDALAQKLEWRYIWSAALTSDLSRTPMAVAAVSLLHSTTVKGIEGQTFDSSAWPGTYTVCVRHRTTAWCFSFANESRSCHRSAPPLSPLRALLTVSLQVGVIVMGAASWIIKHIFLQ